MGQTEPNSQFFADFADFRFSWELQHFVGTDFRRKAQETAEFPENRRKPQNFAETRLSHLVCPFQFLPK